MRACYFFQRLKSRIRFQILKASIEYGVFLDRRNWNLECRGFPFSPFFSKRRGDFRGLTAGESPLKGFSDQDLSRSMQLCGVLS